MQFQESENFTIDGKRTTVHESDQFTWLTIMDSHGAKMTEFLGRQGSNAVIISGGGTSEADRFMAEKQIMSKPYNGIFIFLGGNDVSKGMPPAQLEQRLRMMTHQIAISNPECVIVTGTIIPRADRPDKGDQFVRRCEDVDKMISKAAPHHHHMLNDAMVKEPTRKGGPVTIREDLYGPDMVHLNMDGLCMLQTIFNFVFASVNRNQYDGRVELKGQDSQSFRSALFKF